MPDYTFILNRENMPYHISNGCVRKLFMVHSISEMKEILSLVPEEFRPKVYGRGHSVGPNPLPVPKIKTQPSDYCVYEIISLTTNRKYVTKQFFILPPGSGDEEARIIMQEPPTHRSKILRMNPVPKTFTCNCAPFHFKTVPATGDYGIPFTWRQIYDIVHNGVIDGYYEDEIERIISTLKIFLKYKGCCLIEDKINTNYPRYIKNLGNNHYKLFKEGEEPRVTDSLKEAMMLMFHDLEYFPRIYKKGVCFPLEDKVMDNLVNEIKTVVPEYLDIHTGEIVPQNEMMELLRTRYGIENPVMHDTYRHFDEWIKTESGETLYV